MDVNTQCIISGAKRPATISSYQANIPLLLQKPLIKGIQGKEHRTFIGDHHILLQPDGLLQARLAAVGLKGHVHVLLELGREIKGESSGDPHPLIEGKADAVGKLKQVTNPLSVITRRLQLIAYGIHENHYLFSSLSSNRGVPILDAAFNA